MFCISGKMASAVAPSFHSTKETINYARLCRLLVDVSAHILRETFDKRRPTGDLHMQFCQVLQFMQSYNHFERKEFLVLFNG